MAVYAKAPGDLDQKHASYLTPDREYLVSEDDGFGFHINSDPDCEDPGPCFCLWKGCFHLSEDGSKNWQRIEREDEA